MHTTRIASVLGKEKCLLHSAQETSLAESHTPLKCSRYRTKQQGSIRAMEHIQIHNTTQHNTHTTQQTHTHTHTHTHARTHARTRTPSPLTSGTRNFELYVIRAVVFVTGVHIASFWPQKTDNPRQKRISDTQGRKRHSYALCSVYVCIS